MIISAIKGFNQEWAAVTAIRDSHQSVIGWAFVARCGTERKFPNTHWNDPRGAAIRTLENHECGNAT